MHNPLVIEAIMLIAAIIVGVWSSALYRYTPIADRSSSCYVCSSALAARCACCWIS